MMLYQHPVFLRLRATVSFIASLASSSNTVFSGPRVRHQESMQNIILEVLCSDIRVTRLSSLDSHEHQIRPLIQGFCVSAERKDIALSFGIKTDQLLYPHQVASHRVAQCGLCFFQGNLYICQISRNRKFFRTCFIAFRRLLNMNCILTLFSCE